MANDDGELSYDEVKQFFNNELENFLNDVGDCLNELQNDPEQDRKLELQLQFKNEFNGWAHRVTPSFFEQFPSVTASDGGLLKDIMNEVDRLPVTVGSVAVGGRSTPIHIKYQFKF